MSGGFVLGWPCVGLTHPTLFKIPSLDAGLTYSFSWCPAEDVLLSSLQCMYTRSCQSFGWLLLLLALEQRNLGLESVHDFVLGTCQG